MTVRAAYRSGHDRGVALVAAMWASAVVAVIVLSVLQLVRSDARLGRVRTDIAQLQAIADGAINIVILSMLGPRESQPPVIGTPFHLRFADTDIVASVLDESGKIDLNHTSAQILRGLLASVGVEPGPTNALTEAVLTWRGTPPSGRDRTGLGPGGAPAQHGPFQSVAELQLVPGMTDAIFRQISPLLTVASQIEWIDTAYADPRILRILAVTDPNARAALAQREGIAQGVTPAPSPPGVALGHAFTIQAQVNRPDGSRVTRSAVIRLTGQPRAPLLVYRWG